jgi:hypothetical protein
MIKLKFLPKNINLHAQTMMKLNCDAFDFADETESAAKSLIPCLGRARVVEKQSYEPDEQKQRSHLN